MEVLKNVELADKNIRFLLESLRAGRRYAVLRGGTRSGKTYAALRFLFVNGWVGTYKIASVVAASVPHLRRGALRDFKKIIGPLAHRVEYRASERLFIFPSGAILEFFSADDSAKLRGAQRDWLFINEVNLIDEESFQELDVRTRQFVIMDFNPVGRFWLNDLFAQMQIDLEAHTIVTTYKDNIYLTKEQVAAIESRRLIGEWWRVYGEGQWGESKGRAWYSWDVGEWPAGLGIEVVGVDFGEGAAPTAVVAATRWGDGIIAKELAYGQLGIAELVQILKSVRPLLIVADPAQKDMINELRKLDVEVYPARKMQLIASYALLNNTRVIVDRNARNLIKEAQGLEWADAGRGLLKAGQADHAVDALRYALHALA